MEKKHIFLIGFMGSGKSTIAHCLYKKYGLLQLDMDKYIENEEGRKISSIFEQEGEAYFRGLETEFLKKLDQKEMFVISCGGGVPMNERNVQEMKKKGIIVLLHANPATIYQRVKNSHHRPLLEGNMTEEYIGKLMEQRSSVYDQVADVIVKTDNRSAEEISAEILEKTKIQGE